MDMKCQPPSGGCVLKQSHRRHSPTHGLPAAFGRLCVETAGAVDLIIGGVQPPSGGCVLKPAYSTAWQGLARQPPSGGCVLKHTNRLDDNGYEMPAAFGRLCVETSGNSMPRYSANSSRLRAAVC